MAEIKELYYKKADAMAAAEEFIKVYGGWVGNASADDRTNFSYEDDTMRNMCWSGEINAVQVYGCKQGMAGLFAWWEE